MILRVRKQKHTAKADLRSPSRGLCIYGRRIHCSRKSSQTKRSYAQGFRTDRIHPEELFKWTGAEAVIYINGVKQTTNLFCARLCHSCAPVVITYRRQNEDSFLDAFVQKFRQFGGVPEKVIFDNSKVAVKDDFGAHARKQAGYTALSAHYGLDALFETRRRVMRKASGGPCRLVAPEYSRSGPSGFRLFGTERPVSRTLPFISRSSYSG
jgi:hypothetical protein